MATNNPVTVGMIGIPDAEERRLQVAFDYSNNRPISYIIHELDALPDIVVVNADAPESMTIWSSYRDGLEKHNIHNPLSIMISKKRNESDGTEVRHLRRPLIISRVISTLDRLTNLELMIDREVAIGNDVNVDMIENIVLSADYPAEVVQCALPVALVVDDSLPVRVQMETALKKFTSRIDLAETGEEAIELASENDYDVVFLDVILPGIDGYEICKTIKAGRCKNTPVILLTGNSSPADRIKGNLYGCDTYLIKPLNHEVFEEVVNQYLSTPTLSDHRSH